METLLKVIDNSGGILVKCVKVYKKSIGLIGDKILVSVKKSRQKKITSTVENLKSPVENHFMYKALIIHTKKGILRKDGRCIKFAFNSVILLTRLQEKTIGTRIYGPLLKEFRNKKFMKITLISSKII